MGGNGDDFISAGDGTETIFGDAGDDLLVQRTTTSQILTNTTLAGRGLHTFSLVERVQLIDTSSAGGVNFEVSGYTGPATLIGSIAGNDIVSVTVDADVTLADGNLRTTNGGSFALQNITKASVTGLTLDNTFDVSYWSGTATLTGGTGRDRILSVNDANFDLSDNLLTRSTGGSFTLVSIPAATLGGGASNNTLDATNYSGKAWLYGAGGNDTLRGGSGDDYLDGGTGVDQFFGGNGNDVIVATLSSGATIHAGSGDDLILRQRFCRHDPCR